MNKVCRLPLRPEPEIAGRAISTLIKVLSKPFRSDEYPWTPSRLRWPWYTLIGFHLLLFPQPTYAYIDPGTGSYMVQVLIAGLLGAIVSLKIFWTRIKTLIKGWLSLGKEDSAKDARSD